MHRPSAAAAPPRLFPSTSRCISRRPRPRRQGTRTQLGLPSRTAVSRPNGVARRRKCPLLFLLMPRRIDCIGPSRRLTVLVYGWTSDRILGPTILQPMNSVAPADSTVFRTESPDRPGGVGGGLSLGGRVTALAVPAEDLPGVSLLMRDCRATRAHMRGSPSCDEPTTDRWLRRRPG